MTVPLTDSFNTPLYLSSCSRERLRLEVRAGVRYVEAAGLLVVVLWFRMEVEVLLRLDLVEGPNVMLFRGDPRPRLLMLSSQVSSSSAIDLSLCYLIQGLHSPMRLPILILGLI